MSTEEPAPKLYVDSDWKAQARAEKERMAREEAKAEASRRDRPRPGELPKADFRSLMGVLASQAMLGLGTVGDQRGRVIVDLPGAQFAIDLLDLLEQKTRGNLAPDEADDLRHVLAELRARFVEISNLVARQAVGGPPPAERPGPGGARPASPIG